MLSASRRIVVPAAFFLALFLMLLPGCSNSQYRVVAEMDWADIVVTPDAIYTGSGSAVLRDPDAVTQESVFTVRKKLSENVDDPNYRAKPGDAAFLEKGTKLYRVQGFDPEDVIAAPSERQIGGYQLYVREGFDGLPTEDLERILADGPSSIDVYLPGSPDPLRETSGAEATEFAGLLSSPIRSADLEPDPARTPIDYQIVPDNGEPVLYAFWLADDGAVRLKEDWVLSGEVRKFLSPR